MDYRAKFEPKKQMMWAIINRKAQGVEIKSVEIEHRCDGDPKIMYWVDANPGGEYKPEAIPEDALFETKEDLIASL